MKKENNIGYWFGYLLILIPLFCSGMALFFDTVFWLKMVGVDLLIIIALFAVFSTLDVIQKDNNKRR